MTAAAFSKESKPVPWWLVLLEGISLAIIGILLLARPAATTLVIVQFLGIYWIISGIFSLVSLFVDRTAWGWKLFSGILGILAGWVIIQHPIGSTVTVLQVTIIIFGIQGIIIGVLKLVQGFQGGGAGAIILGIISILLGIYLLANAFVSALALPFVFGIFAVIGGIVSIIQAFRMR